MLIYDYVIHLCLSNRLYLQLLRNLQPQLTHKMGSPNFFDHESPNPKRASLVFQNVS